MAARTELSQIEDYDAETTWFDALITNFKHIARKHNVNVIFTAHVLTVEYNNITKPNQSTISRTLVTKGRKVAATLPVDFDEVYHFDVQPSFDGGAAQYTVITRNTGWDYAKTALPIPTRINFTDGSLYDQIIKGIKEGQRSAEGLISL